MRDSFWKESELEAIAEDLRFRITGGKPVTLDYYIELAKEKTLKDLGRFNVWLAKHEKYKLMSYIPVEVLQVLANRIGNKLYLGDEAPEVFRRYSYLGSKNLALLFHTNSANIITRVRRYGIRLRRTDHKLYTPDERLKIKKYFEQGLSDKEIGNLLGRADYAIGLQRRRFGLKKMPDRYDWNKHPEAKKFLKQNYKTMTYEQLAQHLGLQLHQVRQKLSNLRLRKHFNWKNHPEIDLFLKENYNNMSREDIAFKFGLTKSQIIARLKSLGLKKIKS